MSERYDVVIAGGAAMGSSTAYHLAADPGFQGRVLVVEKDFSYAKSATALSLSSVRQQFSQPINIRVGLYGVDFLKRAKELLAVDGDAPDFSLVENGYLYLASADGAHILRQNHVVQQREGADIALVTPDEIRARYPYLSVEGVALGALGLSREGWFDGYQLMQAFRRKARSLGAVYREDTVVDVHREGARVTGVKLMSGAEIACGAFADTAGASGAAKLARKLGVEIPVELRKRCVFVFEIEAAFFRLPAGDRSQRALFPSRGADVSRRRCGPRSRSASDDFEVNWPQFEEEFWPLLARRVPSFEALKLIRAWAGHYDLNTFDHNAIVGRLPGFENAYLAAGFPATASSSPPPLAAAWPSSSRTLYLRST